MLRAMDDDGAARRDRFRALYQENRWELLGYALRRVPTSADAADVVAETFLVAWRRLDDVPPGRQARPWLFGVARRVLANQRRGALRRNGLADKLRDELAARVDVGDPGEAREVSPMVGAVRSVLAQLGDDDRELLRLTSWEGLTPSELAASLSIPAATVRTRLHRARRRFRAVLDGDRTLRALERWRSNGHVGAGEHVLAPDRQEEP